MNRRQEISRIRQQLREVAGRLAANVEVFLAQRGPVVKGLFQLNGTRCGKANCKCTRGEFRELTARNYSAEASDTGGSVGAGPRLSN